VDTTHPLAPPGVPISGIHVQKIPRDVVWYADPSEPGDIAELQVADFKVTRGINAVRQGIAAVSARLQNSTLRIVEGACPNLLREAELYRYAPNAGSRKGETPLDEEDHALDALRYLIATIDQRKLRRKPKATGPAEANKPKERPWLRLDNEALWTPFWSISR